MNLIYLLLGSNKGDRYEWLRKGLELLQRSCGEIVQQSSIYETAAWGLETQPDFLNVAIVLSSPLTPERLLEDIQEIEKQLERARDVKWGQRTLDIDILFYNNSVIRTRELVIPHPHLQDRRFVLEPLYELNPHLKHPVLGKDVSELLLACKDPLRVKKLNTRLT